MTASEKSNDAGDARGHLVSRLGRRVVGDLVLLLVLTGCGGEQPGPTPKPTYRSYVALGDSYTAGPFIPMQRSDPPGCGRSGIIVAPQMGKTSPWVV